MKQRFFFIALLFFIVPNTYAQVVEDFESWNPYTVSGVSMNEPQSWSCTDSFVVGIGSSFNPFGNFQAQLFRENPGFAGTGAMKLVSKVQDAIPIAGYPVRVYPALATNSLIAIDALNSTFSQIGGTPVTQRPFNTSMQVKTTLYGGDSTFISALLIDNSDGGDSIIARADTILSVDIANYTKLILPFVYLPNTAQLFPTVVRYTISSANPAALLDTNNIFSVHDSTEIVIDNIEVDQPNGIIQISKQVSVADVYPTIGVNWLHIDMLEQENNKSKEVEILSINGQVLGKYKLDKRKNTLYLNDLKSGTYIYSIKEENYILQSGKFSK